MKNLRNLFLTIILITPYHLFSQNLKEGFIILSRNDTLHGYIKENTDENLVAVLYFSKSLTDQPTKFISPQS